MKDRAVIERLRDGYQRWKLKADEYRPIREELFGPEKLIEEAKVLARERRVLSRRSPNLQLLRHFENNAAFLHTAYRSINDAVSTGDPIPPAEEWFIDNYHVIAEQLEAIKEDLPRKFYLELPALANGPLQGFPRTYEMALQLIAHTDSRLDPDIIREFLRSYQTVTPLTTGELWAIASLLRVALIENLKRIILVSDRQRDARKDANRFANRLIHAASQEEIDQILGERSLDPRPVAGAFAVQLILRLRDQPPAHLSAVEWLYSNFSARGLDPDSLIRHTHQTLAGAQVSVSNLIQSLRLLATIDWSQLVEDVSLVEAELRTDPSGHYARCDFATRDRYRHVVEDMARGSNNSEIKIASQAIDLAAEFVPHIGDDQRKAHVGYYLIGRGRKRLEAAAGYRPPFAMAIRRAIRRRPALFYQLPIAVFTLSIVLLACLYAFAHAAPGTRPFSIAVTALATLIPASAIGVILTNWLVTGFMSPRVLPKLDLKEGIPDEYRTIVVLPCLLSTPGEVRDLVSRLEVTYLANNDETLDFALLGDFSDADTQTRPEDEALVSEGREAIALLNTRYPRSEGPRFHIYHRHRLWNETEGKWMGWERKRGKLEEFNRLLLGAKDSSYVGAEAPKNVKFVITLDADTILPRDMARKLVGTLAHPLNTPLLDPRLRQVVEGYGILQPRVSHTLTSSNQTWFSRIFSGHTGIDPYTTAVSDIYQDLFREASYVGKGIYDLAAFSAATDGRFPENTLLSHDLIEGAFARTALVSDVEIFDDHPSTYTSFLLRLHRWVRGDWQIARWILSRVPGPDGSKIPNTLSWLNRWKLFDNLRRSLESTALFLLLLLGWIFLPGSPLMWSLLVVVVMFSPLFTQFLSGILSPPGKARWVGRLWGFTYDAGYNALQSLLRLSFLPREAVEMTDAIVRTLWRLKRRKKLLEWVTAAHAERARGDRLRNYVVRMSRALLLTGVTFVLIFFVRLESLPAALPFLLLWLASPVFAFMTGQGTPRRPRTITPDMAQSLRGYAREIWRFFETFTNDETHWLPPDNFQETPDPVVAPRTSPTNIGFLLLSNIAAYDLGYIGATEFVERTEKTLATLSRLRTFNGHLYNWYSTETLQPLEPRYVSTVDSGNLVAALIVLKQFTSRFASNLTKSFEPRIQRYGGVRDTVGAFLTLAEEHFDKQEREVLIDIRTVLDVQPSDTLHQEQLLQELGSLLHSVEISAPTAVHSELIWWWNASKRVVATHLLDYERPQDLPSRLLAISRDADSHVEEIDFRFLFNEERGILSIGFNVTNGEIDRSSYDLFASEARLTSFVAIAKGDVPQSHWFRMSRSMLTFGRRRVLASWSGSMFEYLMPLLFLSNEPNTLVDVTYQGSVELQRLYGLEQGAPWGVSEAAYNTRDVSHTYQYGPFGVPALGLKRGLARDLVVAPYASFLALLVNPAAAFRNLQQLQRSGMRGRYGFYESMDWTKDRIPDGERYAVVRTFMAHHQGMSLVALDNVLQNDIMQKRFGRDPAVRATSLLLQEKMPLAFRPGPAHVVDERVQLARTAEPSIAREFLHPYVTPPRAQMLSNGEYLAIVTTGGGGYSEWRGIRINRWREDATCDHWGPFLYIKDVKTGDVWSAGFLPTRKVADDYRVVFAEDQVEIHRCDGDIETRFDASVSPEDNAEVRRVTLVNTSGEPREIEVTSYLEISLNTAAADLAHPAFSNLFVQTEYLSELKTLLASRRPRGADETMYWAGHIMVPEDNEAELQEYETDRAQFIGRNRDVSAPRAMDSPLSGTTGAVLDPIFSLRCRIAIPPYSRRIVAVMTMAGTSRDEVITLAQKYRDPRAVQRSKELAAVHANIRLNELSIAREEADLFQRLGGRLIYSDISLRPRPAVLARNSRTQEALWQYGISGDLPICLIRVEDRTEVDMVRQLLRAHEYWRSKGFVSDLVILNEFPSSYFQELQEDLQAAIRSSPSRDRMDIAGGVFLRRADLMPEEDRILLRTVARVQIVAQRGSLARHVARVESQDPPPAPYVPTAQYPIIDPPTAIPAPERVFENGYGGFTTDGKEYVIDLRGGESLPAPWINVMANPNFGLQISETGAGMTWSLNSQANRLTPWSNDAVTDPMDTAIYIRDEESGNFWSPTPQPAPGEGNYVVAHGDGYSRFNYGGYGLDQELLVFVHPSMPVKICKLRLRNRSRRSRTLSVTYFSELALGVNRSESAHFIATSVDPMTGALLATNSYNNEFAGRVAFLWMNDNKRTVSGNRTTFIGPNGSLRNPAAMSYANLWGKVGAGLDPCASVRGHVHLPPLSDHTIVFLFGQANDLPEARAIIASTNSVERIEDAHQHCSQQWDKTLGALQVQTPDPALDLLLNRLLLYQTYACRFYSRSAFYQSGGAFGFRDQLQDALAFVYSNPAMLREHLLRCASRQFTEGDVQHWWHPPTGRGVRTRSSDDLLWLPYCAAHYVATTGDHAVLDETAPYLEAPPLAPDEMEAYLVPQISQTYGSLYEHCVKAIEYSLKFGPHGLPLIGAGDWNDGMNRLGIEGKGESVWLAWFQIDILRKFADICDARFDSARAENFRKTADRLVTAVEQHGWDGEWYRRGFDDDGIPFGSAQNDECRIDSIAQTWAVLSHAADATRARQAIESVEKWLIDREEQMALLFTPPFVDTPRDPGYIKGYLAGIRENGGHYNHAAAWLVAALAELNRPEKALELFHMCSPLAHSCDRQAADKYKIEPYACAGDIYSHPSHMGRGGWSWYTGSAAWLYRAGLEWILGFRLHGNRFTLQPCIPASWPGFRIVFRQGESVYHIDVQNESRTGRAGIRSLTLDGQLLPGNSVPLSRTGSTHNVTVLI